VKVTPEEKIVEKIGKTPAAGADPAASGAGLGVAPARTTAQQSMVSIAVRVDESGGARHLESVFEKIRAGVTP
jgi:hypothetical protein